MTGASLPARIVYTAAAVPLAGAAGFYLAIGLLPELIAKYPQIDPGADGQRIFNQAVGVGAGFAFTAGLVALTLPWIRHRKRRGRGMRTAVSVGLVVGVSVFFAGLGHRLVYDLLFAAWLAYTMAYTFVRYGVLDHKRRRSGSSRLE